MTKRSPPRVSVVVPVRNGAPKLARCLQALLTQTLQPSEILVVDAHYSTDPTREVARRFPVTVVYEDYGTVGGARQVGVEHARGDYVAFTDADCIPGNDWLENLIREFADGIVGVGGGSRTSAVGSGRSPSPSPLTPSLGVPTRSRTGYSRRLQRIMELVCKGTESGAISRPQNVSPPAAHYLKCNQVYVPWIKRGWFL